MAECDVCNLTSRECEDDDDLCVDCDECNNGTCEDSCEGTDTPICDTETNQCVECIEDEDCTDPDKPWCIDNACKQCKTDADCVDNSPKEKCDTDRNRCVECISDGDCAPGEICVRNRCAESCEDDEDCEVGQVCQAGVCLESCVSDGDCEPGQVCEDGVCVEACTDNGDCPPGEICAEGRCQGDDGTCSPPCEGCDVCDDGSCVSSCSACETCEGTSCVDNCEGCQSCKGSSCVDDNSNCPSNQVCNNGTCVPESGTCDPPCSTENCEVCNDGTCESSCSACQTCDNGQCRDNCEGCRTCNGSECVDNSSKCPPGFLCIGGACVPDDGTCDPACDDCEVCRDGTCISRCAPCQICVNNVCLDDCGGCQSCKGFGCVDDNTKCPSGQACVDGTCREDDGTCDPPCGNCAVCVNGQCQTSCSSCESCENNTCVDACTAPCTTCVNGSCEDDCQSPLLCYEPTEQCVECLDSGDCPTHFTCNQNTHECECTDAEEWGVGDSITAPSIDNPADNAVVAAGTALALTCSGSMDTDEHGYCENNEWVTEDPPPTDSITYTWSAKRNGQDVGQFQNGVNTGSFVTWIAPASVGDVQITVTAEDGGAHGTDDDSPVSASITISISAADVDVVSVVWETFGTNVPLDTWTGGTGKRIYPGKQSPSDNLAAQRKKVLVKATVSPIAANTCVYFSWWDVDDPSSSTAPIDDNDSGGNPYGNDNKGSGESLSATSAQTDAYGQATVEFTVSMQPGDNFKIAASTRQSAIGQMTQAKADAREPLPDYVIMSETLTTWRKLWIERDSMGPVATTGNEMNRLPATAVSYDVYAPSNPYTIVTFDAGFPAAWDAEDSFKWGWMVVPGCSPYSIGASKDPWLGHGWVKISQDLTLPGNPTVPFNCVLYDDDWDAATSAYKVTLPNYSITIGAYQAAYDEAFITIEYLSEEYQDQVPFIRNLKDSYIDNESADWNSGRDVESSPDFWTMLMVAAYQGEISEDKDPDAPGCLGAAVDAPNQGVVYLEVIRDDKPINPWEHLGKYFAHEISHGGGTDDHPPGYPHECIQRPDAGDQLGETFCDECLNRMRKDANW